MLYRTRTARSTASSVISALALLGIVVASVVAGPAPAAQAQSGYRICAVFTKGSADGHIGSGLVAKVPKDRPITCEADVTYMEHHFGEAHIGAPTQQAGAYTTGRKPTSDALHLPCEAFTYQASGGGGDICPGMEVGVIYAFYSPFDLVAREDGLRLQYFDYR